MASFVRISFILVLFLAAFRVQAQDAEVPASLLFDRDGDSIVKVGCFGDSITFGVGDGIPVGVDVEDITSSSGGGYPTRLSALLGVPVINSGIPGEELVASGQFRFPKLGGVDVVLIFEGVNDAIKQVTTGAYSRGLQRMVNIAAARGMEPVVVLIPPPCCNHGSLAPFTDAYAGSANDLASVNEIRVCDVARAWRTTCTNSDCELYNVPEGLHPNKLGYDVIAQTCAASILGIDIFTADGAAALESALGLPAGTVVVKPEVAQ